MAARCMLSGGRWSAGAAKVDGPKTSAIAGDTSATSSSKVGTARCDMGKKHEAHLRREMDRWRQRRRVVV